MTRQRRSDSEVEAALKQRFRARVLAGGQIVSDAIADELGPHAEDPAWIKANFSNLVETIQTRAFDLYKASERTAAGEALVEVFNELVPKNASAADVISLLKEYVHPLDRFFLGLTQGRRPRAGNAFEKLTVALFTRLRYPFTLRPAIDGTPDFVLPSVELYHTNPLSALIFTVKRTLRERWRQIVTEGSRGLGFYLATIDENVSARDLAEMMRAKVHLVVPARLKQDIPRYAAAGNVLSFEEFFTHHLDPAVRRWKAGTGKSRRKP
jgi:hypothetical protein